MRNHLPGFTISTLVHAGLFIFAYTTFIIKPITLPVDKPNPIALKLSMFVPPPHPDPIIVPAEPVVTPEPEPVVEVIKKPKPPPPKPIKKPRPKPKPKKQPRPEPVVEAKPQPEPVVEPEIIVQPPPAIVVAPSPEPVDTRISDEYKFSVRQAIEANKRYPRKARRLRQQGTAVVTFTILRDGSIQNLRITQSTGVERLDQAALKAIEKINGRFPLPSALNKASWDFNVPIQYSLI